MSIVDIRAALETRLVALNPPIATALENMVYEPVDNTPYQAAFILFAQPDNPTFGDGFYRQGGLLQVNLCYPENVGAGHAAERAALLREWFPRGLTLTANNTTTHIQRTPEIGGGSNDGNRFIIPVRIRFYANIERV